jgi:hypothetical protein
MKVAPILQATVAVKRLMNDTYHQQSRESDNVRGCMQSPFFPGRNYQNDTEESPKESLKKMHELIFYHFFQG